MKEILERFKVGRLGGGVSDREEEWLGGERIDGRGELFCLL